MLSVRGAFVITQFGQLLANIRLLETWRGAVAERCAESSYDTPADRVQQHRAELEAEQKRLVQAFTKGYLSERDLDTQVDRLRAELQALPAPATRSAEECTEAALVAGETLTDMASYWDEALPEERRDIVWALLQLGGLLYDLERRAVVGLVPRPDMLHVLALGLSGQWERRGDELWLRQEFIPPKLERSEMTTKPDQRKLTPSEREEARPMLVAGKTMRQVAERFGVSRMAIWRLAESHPRKGGLDEKGGDA
jgi:site-specific DNA recombinase